MVTDSISVLSKRLSLGRSACVIFPGHLACRRGYQMPLNSCMNACMSWCTHDDEDGKEAERKRAVALYRLTDLLTDRT